MQIYLARNQVQAGPYTLEQLNNMLSTQQVDLNDLVWHEGLNEWQRLGVLTQEQYFYNPNNGSVTTSPTNASSVTVSRLYGKKESNSPPATANDNNKRIPSPFDRANKLTKSKIIKSQTNSKELASVTTRILAVIINFIIFSLCLVPITSSLDPEKTYQLLEKGDQSQYMHLLEMMYQNVPQHLLILSLVMIIGLFFVQMVLLVKKGQSIGKLVTGIQILDLQSEVLPSAGVVVLRTLVTTIVYYLTPIGLLAMLIDLIVMVTDTQNRSLHDKLAKTYVVKAQATKTHKP